MQTLSKAFRAGRVVLGGAVLVALASCGGGHDDGGPPPVAVTPPVATIPASASADINGFIAFLKTLVPTMQDTAEPLDTTGFVAPTSDTADFDPSV